MQFKISLLFLWSFSSIFECVGAGRLLYSSAQSHWYYMTPLLCTKNLNMWPLRCVGADGCLINCPVIGSNTYFSSQLLYITGNGPTLPRCLLSLQRGKLKFPSVPISLFIISTTVNQSCENWPQGLRCRPWNTPSSTWVQPVAFVWCCFFFFQILFPISFKLLAWQKMKKKTVKSL